MDRSMKLAVSCIIILLIVLSVLFFLGVKKLVNAPNYIEFGKCLSSKGAIFYGTLWCPHCQDQKMVLGIGMPYVNFIDCDKEKEKCLANNITGYPTWVIDGKHYEGMLELNKLSNITGCPLK